MSTFSSHLYQDHNSTDRHSPWKSKLKLYQRLGYVDWTYKIYFVAIIGGLYDLPCDWNRQRVQAHGMNWCNELFILQIAEHDTSHQTNNVDAIRLQGRMKCLLLKSLIQTVFFFHSSLDSRHITLGTVHPCVSCKHYEIKKFVLYSCWLVKLNYARHFANISSSLRCDYDFNRSYISSEAKTSQTYIHMHGNMSSNKWLANRLLISTKLYTAYLKSCLFIIGRFQQPQKASISSTTSTAIRTAT